MRPADIQLTNDLINKLNSFQHFMPTPGIASSVVTRDCLVKQMVDSVRRIRYVTVIKNKNLDNSVCDPKSISFDPLKAAAKYLQNGNLDEAAWLVFLFVHFGKNKKTKWQLIINVYGNLGKVPWTWKHIQGNVQKFRNWLDQNESVIKHNANFGNHRKYESINGLQNNGTGEAISTYINWVITAGGHSLLFASASSKGNPKMAFSILYKSMNAVTRFGRTAKFDYLTMCGKLGIANIEPDSTYMNGSTGPYSGAQLLFGKGANRSKYGELLDALEAHLGLHFGMQVLEDSLCNWQKSPNIYIYFGG